MQEYTSMLVTKSRYSETNTNCSTALNLIWLVMCILHKLSLFS